MKRIIQLIAIIAVLSSTTIKAQEFTSDYIALTVPTQYQGQISYINDNFTQEFKYIDSLTHDHTLLNSFPNTVSNVTVYQLTKDGELKFAGFGISGKNEIYQVIYDFTQSQTINWKDDNGNNRSVLVGVGVRMVAKVKTKKAGINLGNPISLAANMKKVEGSLEVRVTGIGSKKINELIPTTTDLSPSSISAALQAVATIKSHIYDDSTIITPQYLAYNKPDKEANNSPNDN
eukprot:TRINITY_DN12639_c0_g4_i1.p2 TRINITY_DN12639_c0_g4~~TRINITY_DN12639_c0_g4_i1.p2  ORF type:complete len:232 (+),score=32.00 TRINITY_DN12639_c0_g4_i1:2463-3158(+)